MHEERDQGDAVVDQQQPHDLEDRPAPRHQHEEPDEHVAKPTGTSDPGVPPTKWATHAGRGEGEEDQGGGDDERGGDVDQRASLALGRVTRPDALAAGRG